MGHIRQKITGHATKRICVRCGKGLAPKYQLVYIRTFVLFSLNKNQIQFLSHSFKYHYLEIGQDAGHVYTSIDNLLKRF